MTTRVSRMASARIAWSGIALVVALLLLTACGGLPTSETVESGLPVVGAPAQSPQLLPAGPVEDAAAEDIVAGFLRANVSFRDDHEVAREFLTADLARQWRPTQQVLIHEGDLALDVPTDGVVVVTVSVRGTVDESGYLTELPEGPPRKESFTMSQDGGQWRISGFPEGFGVLLSEADFDRQYRSATINYVAPLRKVFVPDVRWFPRGDGLPTSLARAQVQPVPDYLQGAVETGVPQGAELATGAVLVDPRTATATVDLSGPGVVGSGVQQDRLLSQLTQTLLQAPGVQQVLVQAAGRPVEADGTAEPVADPQLRGYGPATEGADYALLRRSVELSPVDPTRYDLQDYEGPAEVPDLPSVPVRWTHVAANASTTDLAAVSVDGRTLSRWRGLRQQEMDGIGTHLSPPSYDHVGGLWVAGRSSTGEGRIWVIDTSEPLETAIARTVEADWIGNEVDVRNVQVAPDDQRAAVHLRDRRTREDTLALSGIVRDRDGMPVSLTEPRTLAPMLESLATVSWGSPTTLAVLGRQPTDTADAPYVVTIGGWLQPLRTVDGATLLRGVPAQEEYALVLLNERGQLYTQERVDWLVARSGDDLIIPGN